MPQKLLSCFPKKQSKQNKTVSTTPNESTTEEDIIDNDHDNSVIVEVFTSQGCKISSEAELLISRLGRGDYKLEKPIIIMGFHVDYWDYMGWKDPFGSSQWTVRQKTYVESLDLDTLLTPQVIVQGRAHCVGNDQDNLVDLVKLAPTFPSPNFKANFQKTEPNTLQVSISGSLRMQIDNQGANIMVALYENGLVTSCSEGENKDRVLSNDYVVRKLEKLTVVKDITARKNISETVNFSLWGSFNSSKCGLVVFVQNTSHQIFGSKKFDLPDNM